MTIEMEEQAPMQVLDDENGPPMAVMFFNLSNATSANDAAIERLVQETVLQMVNFATMRGMTKTDLACVAQEVLARTMLAVFATGKNKPDQIIGLIEDSLPIVLDRARFLLSGEALGQEIVKDN